MDDEKEGKRIKDLLNVMEQERGKLPGQWKYLAEYDIGYLEAYNRLYNVVFSDGKALSAKMKELIVIPLLAFRGREDAVYEHCKKALKLGATRQEILEAIEVSVIPGGAPTVKIALKSLMQIDEEEKSGKG